MNHYASFNDPFECWCQVVSDFPKPEEKSERLQSILDAWGYGSIPLEGDEAEQYIEYVDSLNGLQPNIDSAIRAARITCFSKRNDNLLMWSHYANGLRGFCVEFDDLLVVEDDEHLAEIHEVIYQDNPPIVDTALIAMLSDQIQFHSQVVDLADTEEEADEYNKWLDISVNRNNEIYQRMLATKPSNWEYEEEVRLIYQTMSDGINGEFYSYPMKAVKSIIFGERMPSKQQEVLRNVFDKFQHTVEYKIAKRVEGKFEVVVETCI